ITILLIIIIIFSFVLSPNISLKFASNILSGNLKNNTFTVNSTLKIILSENIKKELIQSYKQNKPYEIKLCLIGQIINGDYIINKIFHPKIIEQSVVHVISQGCPETTLIDIHSHPFDNCLFSNTDFNTYKRAKKTNEKLLMGVMCSENKFLFVNE
ncbi:hypothetical protein HOK68_02195, partial [Candidatus Woesearchaeota archaeon]|nr:hypothetical protein [Candidatus Woesearchaeota archaeon]